MKLSTFVAIAAVISGSFFIQNPAVKADTLWRDSFNHNTLGGSGTYNSGDYTELRDNDINRSTIYDSTIQDRNGNLYDCNSIGSCHSR